MGHIVVGGWIQYFAYVQYMGHTLSNVLVKYYESTVAIFVPYMSNLHSQIYSGLSLIFAILRKFRVRALEAGVNIVFFLSNRSKKVTLGPFFRSKTTKIVYVTKKLFQTQVGWFQNSLKIAHFLPLLHNVLL